MSHMFPAKEDISDMVYAEKIVYDYLANLKGDYTIFHSVRWIKKFGRKQSTWKENDYLIFHKEYGGLVLEVKGGNIKPSGSILIQINSSTGEEKELNPEKRNDPLSQAIDGAYHYRNTVLSDFQNRFPMEAAIWFPGYEVRKSIERFPLGYRDISDAVLGSEVFNSKEDVIEKIYKYVYQSHKKTDVTNEEYREILNRIAEEFEMIPSPVIKKGELENRFLKLTNEQAGLLDYISEQNSATIQGVAGTGKTLIAKTAAKNFADEGRKVLFLCFNAFLYQYLEHTYPHKNVTYKNIHSLIAQFGNTEDLSIPEKRSHALQKIDFNLLDYDDVIIDEAQDFVNEEIIYFKLFTEVKEGHFLVFYDKNQLLTTKEVPEWITTSECKLLLTKNCRNTRQIALTAYNVVDVELNQKIKMEEGEKTLLSFVNDPTSKLSKLLKELTGDRYGYEYNEIVILSLKPEKYSCLKDVNKIAGITITRKQDGHNVFFTTASKFKGLESKVVVVTDIDEKAFSESKTDFYVACSRATHFLVLMVDGNEEKIAQMGELIKGAFPAKAKIIMKTQAECRDT